MIPLICGSLEGWRNASGCLGGISDAYPQTPNTITILYTRKL